jgi:CheY-like chemotaxis protein
MPSTVLIVDDDPDIRECLMTWFEYAGYNAVGAKDGRHALSLLGKSQPPCLILLDLMMPVMTGWEFLSARRSDAKIAKVPVVVLSAIGDSKVIVCEGANAVLRKPIDGHDLLEVVKAYCGDPN